MLRAVQDDFRSTDAVCGQFHIHITVNGDVFSVDASVTFSSCQVAVDVNARTVINGVL